jgi:DNA-directed RNA polymerase subunit H (RpoH/RPB5)
MNFTSLFEHHCIKWENNSVPTGYGTFIGEVNGRTMSFNIGSEECKVLYNEELIVIKENEVERLNHLLFPEVTIVSPTNNVSKLRMISSNDIVIRLSLAFKEDIVTIVRPILFGGAGVQSELMVFRVE